jgi:hypothetical protein
MNIDSILASLKQEQQRIAQAISALEGLASAKTTKRGRPAGKRRPLSAAARKSIAAAQRKRWKLWKAQQK